MTKVLPRRRPTGCSHPTVLSVSLLLALSCAPAASGQVREEGTQAPGWRWAQRPRPAGELFENVVNTLRRRYWDREYRKQQLPGLAAKFRSAAKHAASLAEECAIVDGLLSHIPSSHLALYSKKAFDGMMAELAGRKRWTLGLQIKQKASQYFACKILEDGPAHLAGIRRGDRIVSIDAQSPQRSRRLGRRSDDAYLADAPLHPLHVDQQQSERVRFVLERRPGEVLEVLEIVVVSARYSASMAARNSARVIEVAGQRIGYVHFWYIHDGCVALLEALASGQFQDCDSLILDLRGRGGSAVEAQRIARFFTARRKRWSRPFVALMDKESRSAKEMLAYEFQSRRAGLIIGEKSAGALVPAKFARLGQGMVLMYPGSRLGKYTEQVELKGVVPDIEVAYPLPFSAGADPILARAIRYLSRRSR